MKEKLSQETLIKKIRNSAFNRDTYSISIPINNFFKNLLRNTHGDKFDDEPVDIDAIFEAVPVWQRDNDKWSETMQIHFIENLLKGCSTELMLYEVVDQTDMATRANAKIIDGLQRITAIHRFVGGEIKAFNYSYEELIKIPSLQLTSCRVNLKIYTFSSEAEAIKFYIEINDQITHSKEDINRASKILEQY